MKLLLIAILAFSIYSVSNAYANENAVWPMYKHDPQHTGQVLFKGSEESILRWKFSAGERIHGSPSIGIDGTIYIGSFDNNLYAINSDGTQKWRFPAKMPIESTAAIASDGTIYFTSWDKNMYAIEPSGKGKWRVQTIDKISSSPIVGPDDTIYFGADDGFVYAVYPDGTMKWSFGTEDRVFSTPALAPDGTVYVGSFDNNLYAINSDGTQKWKFKTDGFIFSTPAIASDGTIYFGSYDNNIYALYPNGTMKWSFTTEDWVQASPSIGIDGTIYIGSFDNNLYAINPDGTEKWRFETGDMVVSSAAIDSEGTIYVGSVDTFLYAINSDGTQKWKSKTDARIFSSPAIDPEGTIYVGSVDGNLYAIGKPPVTTEGLPRDGSVNELIGYAGVELYVVSTNVMSGKTSNEISIEILVKNIDSKPRSFDLSSFKLEDVNGNEYDPDPEKSTLKSVRIQSGDSMRVILSFKSDTDISAKQLVYKDVRGVKLTVDLTNMKEPLDSEPMPILMPGSNIGKKIIGRNLEMTIVDERFLESDPQQYIIQLSLRNNGDKEIKYDQSFTYVKDSDGNVYLPAPSGSFSGTLEPGDIVIGQIMFRIPAHVSEVVFVYDDMITGSYFVIPEFPLSIFAITTAVSLLIILSKFRGYMQKE